MCLAVPGKLLEIDESGDRLEGRVQFGGIVKHIRLDFVPEARAGDYIIVHVGFAISYPTATPPSGSLSCSVPFTSTSKQKRRASGSIAASSPTRTPTRNGRQAGCRSASVSTAWRIESAMPSRACLAKLQQIRGNWSPLSISTMRLVPSAVRIVTMPGAFPVTQPMIRASQPRG